MSRALAGAALAALAAALVALAPAAGPLLPGVSAAAAECDWQQRSKRIVHHVKRHGRVQRQVRIRRWWVCVPSQTTPVAAPPASAPGPAPPAPAPDPSPPEAPEITHLSVKALEYSFTLSRPSVAAGEVIVELNNQGEDPHNLNLERIGGAEAPLEVSEAGPLEHRTGRFSLAPGSYRLWCSLPEHDELGMNATLVVDPAG